VPGKVPSHFLSFLFSLIIIRQHTWRMALQASGYENLGFLFAGSLALCLSVCVSLSFFSLSVSLPFFFPPPLSQISCSGGGQFTSCKQTHTKVLWQGTGSLSTVTEEVRPPTKSYINTFGSGFSMKSWDTAVLAWKLDVTLWEILTQKITAKFLPCSWPCEIM
jgi:hypothetical protein